MISPFALILSLIFFLELPKWSVFGIDDLTETYQLSYDGIIHPSIITSNYADKSSEEFTKDMSSLLAKEILRVFASLLGSDETGALISQQCYIHGNKLAQTCNIDHDSEDFVLHLAATFTVTPDGGDILLRIDAIMSASPSDLTRETLVQSVPSINAVIGFDLAPVWSVRSRPSATDMLKFWSLGMEGRGEKQNFSTPNPRSHKQHSTAPSLEANILSNERMQGRKRVDSRNIKDLFKENQHNDKENTVAISEVWKFTQQGSSDPILSLFVDSTLRATTSVAGYAHAEAFVHPLAIAHSEPKRVAIVSDVPLPILKETLKLRTIEEVVAVGVDVELLDMMVKTMPSINDCSFLPNETQGGKLGCVQDPRATFSEKSLVEWLEETSDFDMIFLDVHNDEWLSLGFQLKLKKKLAGQKCVLVVNAGSAPSLDWEHDSSKGFPREYAARDRFLSQLAVPSNDGGIGYNAAFIYDEAMAAPLDTSFIVAFSGFEDAYSRFLRRSPAAIDMDMAYLLFSAPMAPPTLVYDGPTHSSYILPSRAWESWYCQSDDAKELPICAEFLPNLFDSSKYHSNTEVRRDPVKGRSLFSLEKIPAGDFVIMEDAYFSLRVDEEQWDQLNNFIEMFPDAEMYRIARDLIIAYGFESEPLGQTGWVVSFATNATFINHGCSEKEYNVGTNRAWAADKNEKELGFSPAITRRADLFGTLSVALIDIEEGAEILQDYTELRSLAGDDEVFCKFLSDMCKSGEGLVPVNNDYEHNDGDDTCSEGDGQCA